MHRDIELVPLGIADDQEILRHAVNGARHQPAVDADPVIDMDDIIPFFQVGEIFFRCVNGLAGRLPRHRTFPAENFIVGQDIACRRFLLTDGKAFREGSFREDGDGLCFTFAFLPQVPDASGLTADELHRAAGRSGGLEKDHQVLQPAAEAFGRGEVVREGTLVRKFRPAQVQCGKV